MVFEEKIKETDYKQVTNGKHLSFDLDVTRENKVQRIIKVFEKEVLNNDKRLSKRTLSKMAFDNLFNDLEAMTEEEAVELLTTLRKDVLI